MLEYTLATEPLGYIWAIILGLIQGLTEFLPVSSSGHLALARHLGLGEAGNIVFDILLHVATLLVVLAFFWKQLLWYLKNDRIVIFYIIIASIPTGIIGYLFRHYFEALRESPTMICIGLLITAAALAMAEMSKSASYQLRDMGKFGAFFIGLCQTLAIVPGISRSGLTISGAMLSGVDKEEAFRFSFLLSIPVVLGAALLKGIEIFRESELAVLREHLPLGPCIIGFITAVISGYLALHILRSVILGRRLVWFAAYCCAIALIGLAYFSIFG